MSNLESREKSQQVPLEEGGEKMVKQLVSYDPNDKWISIEHAGHDMSMSLENWNKLTILAADTILGINCEDSKD